ncbi:MAG: hypothetical protein V7603_6682 [Micromonosporaceae bacterium]
MDEKRRLIRRLLDQQGRGFAEACGFRVTNSPSNLFGLLYLSMLAAACRDYRRAVALASALRAQGWDSAVRMAEAPPGQRVRVLREAGADRGAGRLAGVLGDLAAAVRDRYRGDLRRLRTEAGRDPDRERRLLLALPGVEHRTVELFFREVQVVWPEIAPFADGPALAAARRLGLGRRVEELRALTGDESEKLAWLLGALARVDQDGAYERAGALARA